MMQLLEINVTSNNITNSSKNAIKRFSSFATSIFHVHDLRVSLFLIADDLIHLGLGLQCVQDLLQSGSGPGSHDARKLTHDISVCLHYSHENHVHNGVPSKSDIEGSVHDIVSVHVSYIVGRPLAAMLANDGADVYSADIYSLYLFRRGKLIPSEETQETACKKSRVIITGVPVKSYKLPLEWVSENTVIINVASFKNVDDAELLKIKGVQYVPLVGKVTVAMLERNLLRLYENFHWKPKKVWQ
ncbi:methylenetetrahydrofolate dehydrogenase [NAD+], putative [Phytophthora infestans T30-4]|uniref:Methylenetetrahydrofolate dehydrogenase [NAD+], putative n=1 Tax=Phytophthora infestans (strain T30-4) TaxID=403677 RepID=D0NPK4_PHYIT|nr:methylenetetrahydrofolate dehydrogenase [NAD+], putative [Phytophthora infestans T30-4]EEY62566.1 methylenetetrahydrofolate dehydrogenase [NAD+], putative [Phytophthora infestans T30-4]|eukprot:XP_002898808.1 methylenetetrahydrofolate dehydrogenase [NAD+], putative [Phytophthora infestans T30-4]